MSRNGAKYKLSHLNYSTGLYNLLLYYLGYLTVSYDFFCCAIDAHFVQLIIR